MQTHGISFDLHMYVCSVCMYCIHMCNDCLYVHCSVGGGDWVPTPRSICYTSAVHRGRAVSEMEAVPRSTYIRVHMDMWCMCMITIIFQYSNRPTLSTYCMYTVSTYVYVLSPVYPSWSRYGRYGIWMYVYLCIMYVIPYDPRFYNVLYLAIQFVHLCTYCICTYMCIEYGVLLSLHPNSKLTTHLKSLEKSWRTRMKRIND